MKPLGSPSGSIPKDRNTKEVKRMNDKERLEKIKEKVNSLLYLGDSEGNGEVNINAIYNDMSWLVSQAEKVEQLQQEIASLKEALNESVKTSVSLDNELQQAQKRIQYLENELRNCGYSDTDLDNCFLFEFQDKQVGWEEE